MNPISRSIEATTTYSLGVDLAQPAVLTRYSPGVDKILTNPLDLTAGSIDVTAGSVLFTAGSHRIQRMIMM